MYSFILPYQHHDMRQRLFITYMKNLISHTKELPIEVCIHEVGNYPSGILQNVIETNGNPTCVKYLFTQYTGAFHRAWTINRGVRELATGDTLVLSDTDLILTPSWFQSLTSPETLTIGWSCLRYLTSESTERYIQNNEITEDLDFYRVVTPASDGAAGGICLMPTELFYEIKGMPEDFYGSWGGEDNAFWYKTEAYGYKVRVMYAKIFHMYHKQTTVRNRDIRQKIRYLRGYNKQQWETFSNATINWGGNVPEIMSASIPIHKQIKDERDTTDETTRNLISNYQKGDKPIHKSAEKIKKSVKSHNLPKLIKGRGSILDA